MPTRTPFSERIVRNFGTLLLAVFLLAGAVFAVIIPQNWSPGELPLAAPGDGNVVLSLSTTLWSENGSDIFRGAGNVGIGTTAPVTKLDIAGEMQVQKIYDKDNAVYFVDPAGDSKLNELSVAAAPTTANNVATKSYVDAASGGDEVTIRCSRGSGGWGRLELTKNGVSRAINFQGNCIGGSWGL